MSKFRIGDQVRWVGEDGCEADRCRLNDRYVGEVVDYYDDRLTIHYPNMPDGPLTHDCRTNYFEPADKVEAPKEKFVVLADPKFNALWQGTFDSLEEAEGYLREYGNTGNDYQISKVVKTYEVTKDLKEI